MIQINLETLWSSAGNGLRYIPDGLVHKYSGIGNGFISGSGSWGNGVLSWTQFNDHTGHMNKIYRNVPECPIAWVSGSSM